MLDALVADKKSGALAQGLTIKDFELFEDGVPQKLRYFSQDSLPLSVVLLFDLTGSVQPQLKALGNAAREVLAHLRPGDEVAVMTFDASTKLLQPYTTDHALLAKAIQSASTDKTSAWTFLDEDMYEAVDEGMKADLPGSRGVLVWFTDGTNGMVNATTRRISKGRMQATLHTQAEATDKLERSGLVVAALIDRPLQEDAGLALYAANPLVWAAGVGFKLGDIERYAAETGGPVLKGGSNDAPAKLAALLDEIRGRYTLGYMPSVEKPAGTLCHLELKLSAEALARHPALKKGRYVVRTRAAYSR